MKKVAIPISNNLMIESFGGKVSFNVFTIEGGEVKEQKLELTEINDIEMLPFLLSTNGITDLILFRLSKRLLSEFSTQKINLFVGVAPQPSEELIRMYLEGTLKSDTNVINKLMN